MTMDYGFKRAFGNESDTLFLRTALQALIQRPSPIRSIRFVKHTFEGMTIESRAGIYDLACEDEAGDRFIVEMQHKEAPDFIQPVRRRGLKFYGLHMLDSLVQRGEYGYRSLPKIYCIGILSRNLLAGPNYLSVINLRDVSGTLVDEQLTLIVVELAKFNTPKTEVLTNLDKLLYTMKTIDKPVDEAPEFWQEEWLSGAIRQLHTRRTTPDECAAYSIAYARQMKAFYQEKRDRAERQQERVEAEQVRQQLNREREQAQREREAVIVNDHRMGMTVNQLVMLVGESETHIQQVLAKLPSNQS